MKIIKIPGLGNIRARYVALTSVASLVLAGCLFLAQATNPDNAITERLACNSSLLDDSWLKTDARASYFKSELDENSQLNKDYGMLQFGLGIETKTIARMIPGEISAESIIAPLIVPYFKKIASSQQYKKTGLAKALKIDPKTSSEKSLIIALSKLSDVIASDVADLNASGLQDDASYKEYKAKADDLARWRAKFADINPPRTQWELLEMSPTARDCMPDDLLSRITAWRGSH